MRNFARLTICVSAVIAIAGCFETTQVYTINPDGSGKVAFTEVLPSKSELLAPAVKANLLPPEKEAAQDIIKFVHESKGVDAWADFTFKKLEDKRISISGVAYFSDISKLELDSQSRHRIKTIRTDKGEMVLEFEYLGSQYDSSDGGKAETQDAPRQMTDEEVAAEIKENRDKQQIKAEMQDANKGRNPCEMMKIDLTFRLPGKVGEAKGLIKASDSEVKFLFEGKKFLEAGEKILADDKRMAEAIRGGEKIYKELFFQEMFGAKMPFKAVAGGQLKPQFDYKAEMEKARAAMPDILKIFYELSGVFQPLNLSSRPAAETQPSK
ncbi:MAG: hypothetical protein HZA50_09980 [Planctomycetes bacterium]|nr:hypothetical protein [Planctomycetota bacterium]